jgi:hypothetical protein
MSITASLQAIDNKGYMGEGADYLTGPNQSTYSLRTCFKEGLLNIAGDRCFLLDTMGIRELMPWEGDGLYMHSITDAWSERNVVGFILSDPTLSEAEKINIISGMFMDYGVHVQTIYEGNSSWLGNVNIKWIPAVGFAVYSENKPAFDQLTGKVFTHLKENGVQIHLRNEAANPGGGFVLMSLNVQFNQAVNDPTRLMEHPDVVAYREYLSTRRNAIYFS